MQKNAFPILGILILGLVCFSLFGGCFGRSQEPVELAHYPLDSIDEVITRTHILLDKSVSSDGNGSIQVKTDGPQTIRIVETGDVDVENARLIYMAKLRTENVAGKVYLEMWCHFPGKGEFFSRALQSPLSGTNEWTSQETPFFLKKGQNPDNIRLNLIIDGKGTVWIDDIRLISGPL